MKRSSPTRTAAETLEVRARVATLAEREVREPTPGSTSTNFALEPPKSTA